MESVTYDKLLTTILVILAICGAIVIIWNAIKAVREMQKPKVDRMDQVIQRLNDHDRMFANDKRMLERHDEEISDIKKGLMATCYGVQVLIEHELHNGNGQEMIEASNTIGNWLRER